MNDDVNDQRTAQGPNPPRGEERANRSAECSAPARNERSCSNASPIVVHTWRIGKVKLDHYDRFHGGELLLTGAA
jgi:hypothetical protein